MAGIAYGGAKYYLHKEVSKAMDMAVMMVSPYASVQYGGVASTMSGELTVEDVVVRVRGFRDEVYIDRIGIDTPNFLSLLELSDLMTMQGNRLPEYFGFIVEGLRIPVDADYYEKVYEIALKGHDASDAREPAAECAGKYGFSPKALADLGYTEQVISMSMTVRDQVSKYTLDMVVNIDDMWDLDANIALSGNIMVEMSKGIQYRPKFGALSLEFTDQSLNERVEIYCEKRGLSPAETLQAQMDAFKYSGESNGIEFDNLILDPYREFLEGKSKLFVTARPTKPIAFSQIDLYKPSDVPALLKLEAKAQ
jgi:hypothetical protein